MEAGLKLETGTLKVFFPKKEYGFITDSQGKDVFFHWFNRGYFLNVNGKFILVGDSQVLCDNSINCYGINPPQKRSEEIIFVREIGKQSPVATPWQYKSAQEFFLSPMVNKTFQYFRLNMFHFETNDHRFSVKGYIEEIIQELEDRGLSSTSQIGFWEIAPYMYKGWKKCSDPTVVYKTFLHLGKRMLHMVEIPELLYVLSGTYQNRTLGPYLDTIYVEQQFTDEQASRLLQESVQTTA